MKVSNLYWEAMLCVSRCWGSSSKNYRCLKQQISYWLIMRTETYNNFCLLISAPISLALFYPIITMILCQYVAETHRTIWYREFLQDFSKLYLLNPFEKTRYFWNPNPVEKLAKYLFAFLTVEQKRENYFYKMQILLSLSKELKYLLNAYNFL